MPEPKLVLIFEDDGETFTRWKEYLWGNIELDKNITIIPDDPTQNLDEARRIFEKYRNADLIVVDACLGRTTEANTVELIKFIKKSGFKGLIIGKSAEGVFLDQLLKAGVDTAILHSGDNIPRKICEMLKIHYPF